MQNSTMLEEVFPIVHENYKHPFVKAGRFCDEVYAVGDRVMEELAFVDPHFKSMDVDLVFNGIPAERIGWDERQASRLRMQQYAETLFGERPTWIMTHVARPVLSKGIWRDLRVLHELEPGLAERGERAMYVMLGTLGGQRRSQDVRQMERAYGWPVRHERGYPDLTGGEDVIGQAVEAFNAGHRAVRALFVNQWDWTRRTCGQRMPEEMTFADIRRGSDVELGLSVYEPFGISQLEPLCFGAVCVVSNVCGCMGYVREVAGSGVCVDNVIEGSFLGSMAQAPIEELQTITIAQRDELEAAEAKRIADELLGRLDAGEAASRDRLERGYELASRMSWDRVVADRFMPALDSAVRA